MGRRNPQGAEEKVQPAAPEQVAAAVDLQKTMGRDRVTGLPHRACFAHVLMLQGQIAARLETRLSVVVLEWEGYAAAGHDPEARDARLNKLVAALRDRLHRTHDVLGCIGPGRLAAMLPFTDGAGADTVARNLKHAAEAALMDGVVPAAPLDVLDERAFGSAPIRHDDDEDVVPAEGDEAAPAEAPAGHLELPPGEGVVIGISSYNGKGSLADEGLLNAAERAVAFAMMNGGDRIVRFDPGADTVF
jgi:GGDEF domain-containing protein